MGAGAMEAGAMGAGTMEAGTGHSDLRRASAPGEDLALAVRLSGWLARRGALGRAGTPALLAGGRANLVWRVGGAVCKLSRPRGATPLFPNDGAAEARALAALRGRDIAPRLGAAIDTPWGLCLVQEYLPPREGASTEPDGPGDLGALLARLHRLPPWRGLAGVPSDGATLRRGGLAMIAGQEGAPADRLRRAGREDAALFADPRPGGGPDRVVLHGDPVPGNVIPTAQGLRLIDWQCPGLGDPALDLALAMSPAMRLVNGAAPLSPQGEAALLEGYGTARRAPCLAGLRPALTWRMACYCLWRMARGDRAYAAGLEAELALLARLGG
ncbi:phosphotransferase family protein [Profundibacterium mesophilum]|uniref:Thiamine kinase n=1 Tax=Profundibacterium mesophilum KAUST100406-0324 TaxID=1037889 RepID=A0A921NW26_9RHOB|nr:aminoglycoside phosphotransferase family protein [Profundibacterium mesophilum]KAF0676391.1 Thiamine kinase [Profundibacterium mesophilum KAUST100406-0324]